MDAQLIYGEIMDEPDYSQIELVRVFVQVFADWH